MSASEIRAPTRLASLRAVVDARPWDLVVGAAIVAWTAALLWIAWSDFVSFRLAKYDLGNMVQAVWSTAHGRPLEITFATGEQGSRLAAHVDPILALLAPLWLVAPTPLTLAIVQIAAVSLGALPVYWLARRHLASDRVAGMLALAYLASPWVAWNALEVFHPVALAIPLLLFAVWFLDSDRLVPFGVCALLAASTGELVGVTIAALGVWYAVERRRRAGVAIVAAGLTWTLLAVYVVVPAVSGGPSLFYGYYETVGGSPTGVLRTLFSDPGVIVSELTTGNDLRYLLGLALPFAGLFLLAPGMAAVGLPQMLANGLSDSPLTTSPAHHYSSAVLPFLFAATVFGLRRFSERRRLLLVQLILLTSVALSLVFGAWPGAPGAIRLQYREVPSEKVGALRAAVELIPKGVPVTGTNYLASHLSDRRFINTVPVLRRSEWVVVDSADTYIPWRVAGKDQPELLRRFLRRLDGSPRWVKVFERQGVFVYRRVSRKELPS